MLKELEVGWVASAVRSLLRREKIEQEGRIQVVFCASRCLSSFGTAEEFMVGVEVIWYHKVLACCYMSPLAGINNHGRLIDRTTHEMALQSHPYL